MGGTGNEIVITILGARGSVPTEGEGMLEFGGTTSCVLVRAGDRAIFLDAGTGIMNAPEVGDSHISILLTHPHLDHLLGLPFFPYMLEKDRIIDFYAKKCGNLSAKDQVGEVISTPRWPCCAEDYPSHMVFHDAVLPLKLGEVLVEGIDSNHPGGGTVYKLSYRGRSFVYATDYEYEEEKAKELIEFARGTDLLLIDGQYTEEELAQKRGYGHSTPADGMKIMRESGAKSVRFVHHDPMHTDEFLRGMEAKIKSENASFARKGEVIIL